MLEKWTLTVLKYRKTVLLAWILLIILGFFSSTKIDLHLTTSLNVPHSSSEEADQILIKHFHENVEGTFTVIYQFKNATNVQISGFKAKIADAARVVPTSQIGEQKALGGTFFVNINTALSLSQASEFTDPLRKILKTSGLPGVLVTGPPAIKSDVTPILNKDLHRGELIGILFAIAILLLVLGFSFQVFTPLIFAIASISATASLVFLIAQHFLVVLYIPNIVELIGLGLAIDYSLLMVFRYRRELAQTPSNPESAVLRTMQSAGKTVMVSGVTVAIGLATLILVPIPFIRSLGITSALVPLVSILTAVTLQPIILLLLPSGGKSSLEAVAPFARVAEFIIRKPLKVLVAGLVLVAALSASLFSLHITPSSLTAVPANLESQRAITLVSSKVGSGVVTPNQMIIDLGSAGLSQSPSVLIARKALTTELSKNPEALVVASGAKEPYVEATGRYLRIFIFARHSFGEPQAQKLVSELRKISLEKYGFSAQAQFYLGGAAAQGSDLLKTLGRSFPWIIALALLATFLFLTRILRSVVLPLKAILLDLVSLATSYGIVVFAFGNQRVSSWLGIYHLNQIEAWALVFLFVLLFGVSMDYEVFIISRIKEAKLNGAGDDEAIKEGVAQTGIVVTSAALIFIGAVSGLAFGHFAGLQEIGIGLGFGVLVDATIVRGLLLPSAMVLLGKWNWWLPSFHKDGKRN